MDKKSTPWFVAAYAVALFLTLVPLAASAADGGDLTDPEMALRLTAEPLGANPQRTAQGGLSVGPDVTIIDLDTTTSYGSG